ncbi:MAG: DUF99 family protein [Methanomicrobiales archaeon]|nr:DUF99 family protein [Methanomicrobiales archaeon]
MHVGKKGLRALGIAESFADRSSSTLAGVVMRKDMQIDGIALTQITVGGMDATEGIERIVDILHRHDINVLMISGAVIAWYNIIDPGRIHEQTELPLIMVTYEESEGLEGDIIRHFPGDDFRLDAYRRLGIRNPVLLSTGYTVYIRAWGIPESDAAALCNAFTKDGKIPEPLRVARLIARAVTNLSGKPGNEGHRVKTMD